MLEGAPGLCTFGMTRPFRALAPFARAVPAGRPAPARCELCAAPIGEPHAHVVELGKRALACACTACAVLFRDRGAGGGRFRTVPDRVLADAQFAPGDAEWAAMGIPVRLAFVVRGDGGDHVRGDGGDHGDGVLSGARVRWTAYFPSPGGAVEAELPAAAADALMRTAPLAARVEPDVEALLLHRPRAGAAECWLVPLDLCHELAGLVRQRWRGFSGGDEAEQAIDDFFARLRARAGANP